MSLLSHELRLLLRSRMAMSALALIALLSVASIIAGMVEVAHQRTVIARIAPQQAEDIGAIANWVDHDKDAGSAAYYSFHPTWDAPSPLAFAALGMRDVSPYILRVRALGLEAQLYDGEAFNPELALPGRFDFAFVLVYLVPLFVIALFHDLVSSEREAGRLRMLQSLPGRGGHLWLRRVGLRFGLVYGALVLPLLVGALFSGVAPLAVLAILLLVAGYLVFWIILTLLVGCMAWSSVANAATLAGIWLVLTLVLPTIAHVAINQAIPVGQGVELTLAQREAVNRAWDIPREDTMDRFYASHPEWRGSPPLPKGFHYKWYFAFHQVGDESVAPQVAAYRAGLEARDIAAGALGWVLPSVGVQAVLARLADTDLKAQLAYQDRVRAYHARLRQYYYGYLFADRPFGKQDFDRAPRFGES